MIEFYCASRKPDGTPVVTDLEVMAYAEAQIRDYKPEFLKAPGKLNVMHFVESYLEAPVEVQDIRFVVPGAEISGVTVFRDAMITVMENGDRVEKEFAAGTIIIDQGVITRDDSYTAFTTGHEAGHYCMHYPSFCGEDVLAARHGNNRFLDKVMCRSTVIGSEKHENRKWTDQDFMEHQANVYSATILMPRPSFIPFVQELNRKAGFPDGIFQRPPLDPYYRLRHWFINLKEIGQTIAETYGVSDAAAFVHMKRCGLITPVDPKEGKIYIRRGVAV